MFIQSSDLAATVGCASMIFAPAFGVITLRAIGAGGRHFAGQDLALADAADARGGLRARLGHVIRRERIERPGAGTEFDRLRDDRHIDDGIVGRQRAANSGSGLAGDGDFTLADRASSIRAGHAGRNPHRRTARTGEQDSGIIEFRVGSILGDFECDRAFGELVGVVEGHLRGADADFVAVVEYCFGFDALAVDGGAAAAAGVGDVE